MDITRIDHATGKGEYIVQSRYGPAITITLYGPTTLTACKQYIKEHSITGTPSK